MITQNPTNKTLEDFCELIHNFSCFIVINATNLKFVDSKMVFLFF